MKRGRVRRKIVTPIVPSRWPTCVTAGAATAPGCAARAGATVNFESGNQTFNAAPGAFLSAV